MIKNFDALKKQLRELAAMAGCGMGELIAMSRKNDPFNAGSETDVAVAQWFMQASETVVAEILGAFLWRRCAASFACFNLTSRTR